MEDTAADELSTLFGITRVYGFVNDAENHDIVLIGARYEPGKPLLLDDFIELFKNINDASEPPGCSIDPSPAERDSMKKITQKFNTWDNLFAAKTFMAKWQSHPSYQLTRVFGVNKNSHIAQIMIDADYMMKKIAAGTLRLSVAGFKSYMQLSLDDALTQLETDRSMRQKDDCFVRFWFSPSNSRMITGGNTVLFTAHSLQLSTEEMIWKDSAQIEGLRRSDPVAEHFAGNFTSSFERIRPVEPLFAQLEALYRLYAVQRMLIQAQPHLWNVWKNAFLRTARSKKPYFVPDSLPGVYTYDDLHKQDAQYEYEIRIPMAGGVTFEPTVMKQNPIEDTSGVITRLEEAIRAGKAQKRGIAWTFQLPFEFFSLFPL